MKLFIVLTIALFLMTNSASAQTQQPTNQQGNPPQPQSGSGWIQQNSGTSEWVSPLFPLNKDTVWGLGIIPIRTSDGGGHWLQQSAVTSTLTIYVQDDTTIFGVRGDSIIKSTDGGKTWPIRTFCGIETGVNVVTFIGRDTGYALGNYEVARTYDGGKTWTAQQQQAQMQNIAFADASHGFIVTPLIAWSPDSQGKPRPNSAEFAYTSDAGVTWIHTYSDIPNNLQSVCAFDDSTALAVGFSGSIILTTDRGISWTRLPSGTSDPGFYCVNFADRLNGGVVGTSGWILHTFDGGKTWIKQNSGVTNRLSAITFLNDTVGFASGLNGVILSTTNGGSDWVQVSPLSTSSITTQSYPEPSTGNARIQFSLPQLQNVTIQVFDMTGSIVKTVLQHQLETTGDHTVAFDGSALPSGTYNYCIQTDRFVGSGKITIVK